MKDPKKNDRSDRSKNDTATPKPASVPPARTGAPEPPRTTRGKWTVPKFGSAGSGGAELEPGPERD